MKSLIGRTKSQILLAACSLVLTGAMSSVALAGDIQGKVAVSGLRSAARRVVYIDGAGGHSAPGTHARIDQRKMTFTPHVLVVQQGTTVDFLNSDPLGHNVYWPSVGGNKGLAFNLGTWPQGQKKSFTFNNPESMPVLCNVHPTIPAYIIVCPA